MEENKMNLLDLRLTINQVSQLAGVEKYTLRYWEKRYGEFLNPVRSQTGHRRYTVEDLNIIQAIKNLSEEENLTHLGVRLWLSANYPKNGNK